MTMALSAIRQQVGRLLGAGDMGMITGTPSGGYSTTAFQSALNLFEDSYFVDWMIRFYSGTHKDITRTVSVFAKTNGVVTFTPAVTGNIDATDLFELHRDFTPEEINDAINMAIMMVETEALVDKVDETLVVNDLLIDGAFEVWTSSSVLTNWATGGTGTLARESTTKLEGSYSAKLTNTAANAFYITQSVSSYRLYLSVAVSLSAWVYCTTASRVRLSLTDGVSTWYSSYHGGTGWENLTVTSKTLSSVATALTAQVRIETGGSIDAYADKMYLISTQNVYEYTIPAGFHTIEAVYEEQSTVGKFSQSTNRICPEKGWRILRNGSTKKIWFDPSIITLTAERKLRVEGQSIATQLTLDADTTDITPAYLVQQAAAILHQSRIDGKGNTSEQHDIQSRLSFALADKERRKISVAPRGQRV